MPLPLSHRGTEDGSMLVDTSNISVDLFAAAIVAVEWKEIGHARRLMWYVIAACDIVLPPREFLRDGEKSAF